MILKLFDKVVLLIWGHLLSTDTLQFGYKVGTSTTQCSWLVMEVANYFLRHGTCPIITLLDCSKAFDTCKFSILFQRLLDRGMPAIIVRVIVSVYEDQYAWVEWGSCKSNLFSIVNGTRQGSILSPALFAVYVDDLLIQLRRLGVGCRVAGVYMGAMGFCDDLILLAPSRDGMQYMLDTCEKFATRNNLKFSTDPNPEKSKSKFIFMCGLAKRRAKPANLTLNGKELPWVESAAHLGHIIHESGTMDRDTRAKRSTFIDESVQIRETFGFANPCEVIKAVKVYCGSHYGSMLWDLGSPMADQYFSAWRTCVKLAWQLPRATHTYFVDHLLSSDLTSVRTDVLGRYGKFVRGLYASPSREVSVMCSIATKDVCTTTGRNLYLIQMETGLNPLQASAASVKAELGRRAAPVPDSDNWRLGYLAKLLEERGSVNYEGGETGHLTVLIESLCTS